MVLVRTRLLGRSPLPRTRWCLHPVRRGSTRRPFPHDPSLPRFLNSLLTSDCAFIYTFPSCIARFVLILTIFNYTHTPAHRTMQHYRHELYFLYLEHTSRHTLRFVMVVYWCSRVSASACCIFPMDRTLTLFCVGCYYICLELFIRGCGFPTCLISDLRQMRSEASDHRRGAHLASISHHARRHDCVYPNRDVSS